MGRMYPAESAAPSLQLPGPGNTSNRVGRIDSWSSCIQGICMCRVVTQQRRWAMPDGDMITSGQREPGRCTLAEGNLGAIPPQYRTAWREAIMYSSVFSCMAAATEMDTYASRCHCTDNLTSNLAWSRPWQQLATPHKLLVHQKNLGQLTKRPLPGVANNKL
jgi:hypothetical protein